MRYLIVVLHKTRKEHSTYYNVQETGLAKALTKLGFDCYIIYCVPEICDVSEETTDGIHVIYFPAKSIGIHSRFDWNLILKYNPDIVQINGDNQIFAPDLAHFLKKHNVRYHFYIGVTETNSQNPFRRMIMTCLYTRNIREYIRSNCFAKTPAVAEDLRRSGVKDVTLAPVGLDTEIIPEIAGDKTVIKKELDLPQDKKLLLFVGKLEEYKNPLMALELLKMLPEDYILIIIGKGALEASIREEIVQNDLENRVIFRGQIPNREVMKYYYICDYSLNFNTQEIFGMSILEAMYQGCTVIALHAPGPDYIIQHSENGYLAGDLADMVGLIENSKEISSEAKRDYIKQISTWEKTAKTIKELTLNSLIATKSGK